MNISIEIVPRDEEHVCETLEAVSQKLPRVNTINIPDIIRFKTRSWRGCELARNYYSRAIPHIRAVDFSLHEPFSLGDELERSGIDEILIVSGDTAKSSLRTVHPTTSIALIKKLREELPHLTIYAAIDPYRQDFMSEYQYSMEKLEAGAVGFFTQPFFDTRMMGIYADLLPDVPVYWGVAPVLTENSKNYWETVNRAVFPAHFELTMDWNRQFAREALDFVEAHNGHIYYMPIRADVIEYLEGIL